MNVETGEKGSAQAILEEPYRSSRGQYQGGRSILLQPIADVDAGDRDGIGMVYTDYDLSIPDADFRVVTLGASQYLYWLSTVTKEKESDPDIWRINGVYCDAATGIMSDEIVIAEFTLPDAEWNGRTYGSVPFEVTLTESGTGFITAKPNTPEEDSAVAPLTLYSFPITLKPVMAMKAAALMETTVLPGEMIAADYSMMNEGNMGIGSFDIDIMLMDDGREARKLQTLHADCLCPDNSALILHTASGDVTVAKGEQAFYRLKDFDYTPRQHEWIVSRTSRKYTRDGGWQKGDEDISRVTTNALVPGAPGGYTGAIRIPPEWEGRYDLRLKLANVSTYTNWMEAVALASRRPGLVRRGFLRRRAVRGGGGGGHPGGLRHREAGL